MTAKTAIDPRPESHEMRSTLRRVALPSEHGGWGLTLEPVIVAAVVAPTVTTLCLGAAALLGFLARTPVKVLLVDIHRGRRLYRTRLAAWVAGIEIVGAVALLFVAAATARSPFWWPAALAAPLVAIELWFDMRSRSRRLIPELCGAVGIAAIASAALLADGEPDALAVAVWLVLAARAVAAIVVVRSQVRRLHSRPSPSSEVVLADLAAMVIVAIAVVVEPAVWAGAVAVLAGIGAQHLLHRIAPTRRAVVLGLRQSAFGLAVSVTTGLGLVLA